MKIIFVLVSVFASVSHAAIILDGVVRTTKNNSSNCNYDFKYLSADTLLVQDSAGKKSWVGFIELKADFDLSSVEHGLDLSAAASSSLTGVLPQGCTFGKIDGRLLHENKINVWFDGKSCKQFTDSFQYNSGKDLVLNLKNVPSANHSNQYDLVTLNIENPSRICHEQ